MTQNGKDDSLEVAHVSGFQGIRIAMQTLAGENGEGGGNGESREGACAPLETTTEYAPHAQKTCAVCAATNDGDRETCWNCGASLRRVR